MLYKDYRNYVGHWKWDNFSPKELACGKGECEHCDGEYWHDPYALDMLQKARDIAGKAFTINSARRCEGRNRAVGGSLKSMHKEQIAFDISLRNHSKDDLLFALYEAGFTTFGLYNNFIHVDTRPWRLWISGNKREWQAIYDEIVKGDS